MNILNLVAGSAAPVIAGKVAGMFGVPEATARKVVAAGIPVLLAALMKRSASPGGADQIAVALGGMSQRNPLDALASGDPAQAAAASSAGSNLLASILGGGAGALASKLGGYAGVDAAAAGPLLGMTGAMALGGLKKAADEQGLDAAGVLKMLDGQKADIAKAIPADFARALAGSDIVAPDILQAAAAPPAAEPAPRAAPAAAPPPRPTVTKAPPAPAPKSGGLPRWLLPLVAALVLLWIAFQFFGGQPEAPVVEAPAPAAEPAAPATETAEPAVPATPVPAETAAANPLVIDGVDIGTQVTGLIDQITGALAGVTDMTTAQAAVPKLTEVDAALGGLQSQVGKLSSEGKSSLAALITAALPAIHAAADKLLVDSAIGPVLKPAVDGVLAKLDAFAA